MLLYSNRNLQTFAHFTPNAGLESIIVVETETATGTISGTPERIEIMTIEWTDRRYGLGRNIDFRLWNRNISGL